jgi:iron(III) transport system substrate-binding protein
VAELATYRGADRQQILEAGARSEGRLGWYTSLAGDVIDKLTSGFKQKYPFIQQVDVFRGDEGEIITRSTQEAQSGQQVFDVLESQYTPIRILSDAGLLTPYFSPAVAAIPTGFRTDGPNGSVTDAVVRISYIGFGYNTSLVPESAAPKTRDDLMSPALTGKISLAGSTTGNRWVGSVLQGLGDEKGKQWLADFAAKQKPTVQQVSGKALLDLIAKGEAVASPTIFEDHVLAAIATQKAPVKWVPIEPVVANAGSGALASKAPHPNAALLFLDYLLGPDGQKILKDTGYSTPEDKVDFKWWIPEAGKSADQVEQDAKKWADLFKTTFRS